MAFLPRIKILHGGPEEAWNAGFNARTNMVRIEIFDGIAHFAAVLAHERNNFWFKWTRFFISIFMRRELELRGKAVEVVVARDWYGIHPNDKLDEEARSLMRYSQFKGSYVEELKADLVKRLPTAERWVKARRSIIQADYERGGGRAR